MCVLQLFSQLFPLSQSNSCDDVCFMCPAEIYSLLSATGIQIKYFWNDM